MPPLSSYSSQLDGSLRIVTSNNSSKHGNGSLLVQNGAEFFGSDNQYLKSSNASADLYVQSAKDLRCESVGSRWDSASTYNVNATSSLNLVSVQQAKLESTSGDCRIKASSSVYEEGQHRFGNYSSSIQDTAYGNVIFTATTGNFQTTSNANATILSNTGDSKLYATSGKADVKGASANLQSTGGNVSVQASSDVNLSGVNVYQTATTKCTISAPEFDINCATLVKVEAPTVEIGKTSDVVTISQAGKQTNVEGNLTIAGNFTVNGTTTTVDTQNVLVKDNLMVLNCASEIGKDAGLIFHRNNADSTSFY